METNVVYATGKRKTSIARVWLSQGDGTFVINKQTHKEYFKRPTHFAAVNKPLLVTGTTGLYTVKCTVSGGGQSGQAGAVAHGLSRAIAAIDEAYKAQLREAGLMTRDSRKVERKKCGHKKARRSFQFSKR